MRHGRICFGGARQRRHRWGRGRRRSCGSGKRRGRAAVDRESGGAAPPRIGERAGATPSGKGRAALPLVMEETGRRRCLRLPCARPNGTLGKGGRERPARRRDARRCAGGAVEAAAKQRWYGEGSDGRCRRREGMRRDGVRK